MQSFSTDEIRTLSAGIEAMYRAADLAGLCERTMALLGSLIPNEVALFNDRTFRAGGWCGQFARLLEIDLADVDADGLSPDDSSCGVQVVVGMHSLSFSPRGRFVLQLLQPHFARARQMLANPSALRERAVGAPSTRSVRLTPREREVLYWVSEGKTNGQIGVILNASSLTVKKHLEHIFQKLGVETRTSATVRGIELGLLATLSLATV